MRIRLLSALALSLALVVAISAVAVAQRAPTASESASIKKAVSAFIHKSGSPAAKNNRVTRIRVSTVNDDWALVTVNSKTVGSAVALLKKSRSTWKVKEFGTGGFDCLPPKAVIKDLHFGCVPNARGARTVTWKNIVSPTKQIRCNALKYEGPGINCSAPYLPRIGEFDPYYGLKTHGHAHSSQRSDYAGYSAPVHTLHYGETWKWAGISCKMATSGLTCTNQDHHGFLMAQGNSHLFAIGTAPAASVSSTCNVSSVSRKLGPTYVTSLSVTGTTCSAGVKLVKAYYQCRKAAGGVKGRCVKKVSGYACAETRQSIPTQFNAKVTCRKGRATVIHSYTQFT